MFPGLHILVGIRVLVWAATTKLPWARGFNNKRLYLTVLEGGTFKGQVLADAGRPLPGSEMAVFLPCSQRVERVRDLFGVLFIRALIP